MEINDRDFTLILQFIEEETGIALPDISHRSTRQFLSAKLSEQNTDMTGYLELLKNNRKEYDEFLNIITINETYFFREEKHFTLLDSTLLPELYGVKSDTINIWSAACSTGEEAISLAALLHRHAAGLNGKICTVYATDINPAVLSFFRKGCYAKKSFREDGAGYLPLLNATGRQENGIWHPGREITNYIRIMPLNLYSGQFTHLPQQFRIIFIRNTLLYMRMETRLWIIDQLVKKLEEDGCLFLSATETALVSHPGLVLEENNNVYFFRKKSHTRQNRGQELAGNLLKKTIKDAVAVRTGLITRENKPGLTLNDIAVIINARMNNSLFYDKNDLKIRAALILAEIIKLINAGSLENAGEKLIKLEDIIAPNELVYYLHGYMEMLSGNTEQASRQFQKALLLNNSFWLARFHLARLLARESPGPARNEFLLCRKYIEHYMENNSCYLQFLLEDFNPGYFKTVCDKWLAGAAGRTGE